MAKAKYVPYFPKGVELKETVIYDSNINTEVPINQTAKIILSHIDSNNSVSKIVENLQTMFKIDEERLYADINNLLDGLNSRYMLNWKYTSSNKLKVQQRISEIINCIICS